MTLVMPTASDRSNYIRHFENPLGPSRLEIGFQYYMAIFDFLNIEAQIAIVITCCLIYFLFARTWFLLVKLPWLESLLLFNFFSFSLLNYYIGTSIRMGLAIGSAVLLATLILLGKKKLLFLLPLPIAIHFGALYFVGIFSFFYVFRNFKFSFHILAFGFTSLLFVLTHSIIIRALPLGNYYLQYFNSDFGRTGRPFSFTVLFYLSYLLVTLPFLMKLRSLKPLDRNILVLNCYGLPLLTLFLMTTNPVFGRLLMPSVFFAAAGSMIFWGNLTIKLFEPGIRLALLFSINIIALVYSLKMYNFFSN